MLVSWGDVIPQECRMKTELLVAKRDRRKEPLRPGRFDSAFLLVLKAGANSARVGTFSR